MNADTAYSALGPCEDREYDLVDYVDDALDDAQRSSVQRHLEACGRCRAFVREFGAMHAALGRALPRVEAPAGFDARLQARIDRIARGSSRDVALARAEGEYRRALASLRQGLGWRTALNAAAAAAVAGSVAVGVMTVLPSLTHAVGLDLSLQQTWTFGIGAIALAAGCVAARITRDGASAPYA